MVAWRFRVADTDAQAQDSVIKSGRETCPIHTSDHNEYTE